MATGETDTNSAMWLLCRVGRSSCALPLEHVIETLRPLPIEPVTDAPRSVLGLSVIRGIPIPVIDIGALIGESETHPQRMVTLTTGTRRVALTVGSILGVRSFESGSFSALPPLLQEAVGHVVSAIGTLDTELLLLLRAARLVPESWLETIVPMESAS
jgi:purine-binding chemotaxis protein CheW